MTETCIRCDKKDGQKFCQFCVREINFKLQTDHDKKMRERIEKVIEFLTENIQENNYHAQIVGTEAGKAFSSGIAQGLIGAKNYLKKEFRASSTGATASPSQREGDD